MAEGLCPGSAAERLGCICHRPPPAPLPPAVQLFAGGRALKAADVQSEDEEEEAVGEEGALSDDELEGGSGSDAEDDDDEGSASDDESDEEVGMGRESRQGWEGCRQRAHPGRQGRAQRLASGRGRLLGP